jgi:hypothetical protein
LFVMAETSFLAFGILHCSTTRRYSHELMKVSSMGFRSEKPSGPWRVPLMTTEMIVSFLRFRMMAHANHAG